MKVHRLILLIILMCWSGLSADYGQEHKNVPWTHLNFNDPEGQFQFIIVSDRTGGCRPGVFADAVQKINYLQPEFVISVGDLIEGYTKDKEEILRQWDEFDTIVRHLHMPFFYVAGNHDITNDLMTELWEEKRGPSYYHFVYKNTLFLCLNSEDPPRKADAFISDKQIEYFKGVLAKVQDVKWTIVVLHKPMWEYGGETLASWQQFESMLEGRDYTVFAGHKHQFKKTIRKDKKYFRLATTGGGSSLVGPRSGYFDHIMWVTMKPDGPVIANLTLEGIFDEDPTVPAFADMVADVTAKIRSGKSMQSEPVTISVEDGDVKGGMTEITIKNFAPYPMSIEGVFIEHPDFNIEPQSIRQKVLPLLADVVKVKVSLKEDGERKKGGPIIFNGKIAFNVPGVAAVETGISHSLDVRILETAETINRKQ